MSRVRKGVVVGLSRLDKTFRGREGVRTRSNRCYCLLRIRSCVLGNRIGPCTVTHCSVMSLLSGVHEMSFVRGMGRNLCSRSVRVNQVGCCGGRARWIVSSTIHDTTSDAHDITEWYGEQDNVNYKQ